MSSLLSGFCKLTRDLFLPRLINSRAYLTFAKFNQSRQFPRYSRLTLLIPAKSILLFAFGKKKIYEKNERCVESAEKNSTALNKYYHTNLSISVHYLFNEVSSIFFIYKKSTFFLFVAASLRFSSAIKNTPQKRINILSTHIHLLHIFMPFLCRKTGIAACCNLLYNVWQSINNRTLAAYSRRSKWILHKKLLKMHAKHGGSVEKQGEFGSFLALFLEFNQKNFNVVP